MSQNESLNQCQRGVGDTSFPLNACPESIQYKDAHEMGGARCSSYDLDKSVKFCVGDLPVSQDLFHESRCLALRDRDVIGRVPQKIRREGIREQRLPAMMTKLPAQEEVGGEQKICLHFGKPFTGRECFG